MRCFEIGFLKFVFVATVALVCLSCCSLLKANDGKKQLKSILSSFVGKTPNQLYGTLGKPDEYKVVLDKKSKITYALVNYKYIFNFQTRDYDCIVSFITDKTQQKIKDYQYNSEKCFYITMY